MREVPIAAARPVTRVSAPAAVTWKPSEVRMVLAAEPSRRELRMVPALVHELRPAASSAARVWPDALNAENPRSAQSRGLRYSPRPRQRPLRSARTPPRPTEPRAQRHPGDARLRAPASKSATATRPRLRLPFSSRYPPHHSAVTPKMRPEESPIAAEQR